MRPSAKIAAGGSAAGLAVAVALGAQPMVEQFEGLRNDPYWDIARVRTVCYGETEGLEERYYPTPECKRLLTKSLTKHTVGLLECVPHSAPLPTLYAFASFAYNVGVRAACGSTATRRLREGDVAGACDALLMWNKITRSGRKVFSPGLANRRGKERALCMEGVR